MSIKKSSLDSMRLKLEPMGDEALAELRDKQTDEDQRAAYQEMLEGSRKDPENQLWHTCWSVIEKKTGTRVGGIWFQGPPRAHTVTIRCGIDPEHQGNMFAAEALENFCVWAFGQKGVYFVEATATKNNHAAKWSLEHAAFRLVEELEGVEFWRREKPKSQWMYVCAGLGLVLGGAIGAALGDMNEGLVTGLCVGLVPGIVLYVIDRQIRKKKHLPEQAPGILRKR